MFLAIALAELFDRLLFRSSIVLSCFNKSWPCILLTYTHNILRLVLLYNSLLCFFRLAELPDLYCLSDTSRSAFQH